MFPASPPECAAAPLAPRPHGHTWPLSLGCSQDAPPPGPPRIAPRPLGVLLLLCASPSQQSQETRTPRAQDRARRAEATGACLPRAVRRLSARPSQRPPRGLRVHARCRSGGGGQWSPDWDGEGGRPHLEALPLIITGCTPRHGAQRHSPEAPFHPLWDCGCFGTSRGRGRAQEARPPAGGKGASLFAGLVPGGPSPELGGGLRRSVRKGLLILITHKQPTGTKDSRCLCSQRVRYCGRSDHISCSHYDYNNKAKTLLGAEGISLKQ